MFILMKNEFIKLFSKKSSWILQIFLVLCMFGMSFMIMKSNDSMKSYREDAEQPEFKGGIEGIKTKEGIIMSEYTYWNQTDEMQGEPEYVSLTVKESVPVLEDNLKMMKSQPKKYDKVSVKVVEKQLAFYKSYQENGETPLDPMAGTTSAQFFSSFGQLYVLPTLFAVIIASMIIAAEFSGGTIKLLLTRPYSRMQILWSKYIVAIIYGFMSSLVMAISAFVFSYMLPHQSLNVAISEDLGGKTAIALAGQLFSSNFLLMILYITIALFFSAVIRSQALAVGVGMGVLFSGSILGQILPSIIEKYDWLKWLLFNLLGLNNQVLDSAYSAPGNLSILATVIGLVIYIALIYTATLALFNKRDVALS
ncbi:ABC-2 type transport system permease [Enterococcus sp. AZ194]|uniref:ABC transporter permease n=1 Tax=Enterococcus sp. AZ194 TaxID=2774629 RepID=UPI003F2419A3